MAESHWPGRHLTDDQINEGFGDLTAPLAEGEHIAATMDCNHRGCDWRLPIEWRQRGTTTRLRPYAEANALGRAHIEEHQLANWKGPLHDR